MKKLLAGLIILLIILSYFLISHRSVSGDFFGRYSGQYFVFLVGYLLMILVLVFLYLNFDKSIGRFQRIFQNLIEIDASSYIEANFRKLILFVIAIHSVLVFLFLPPTKVLTEKPLLSHDYAVHYHRMATVTEAIKNYGKHWAYTPAFAAGYPEGTISDVDMKFFEILGFCLNRFGLKLETAFNLIILFTFLGIPFILYFTAKNLRLSKRIIFLIVLTGTLYWHSSSVITHFNSWGIFTYVFSVYWMLLVCSFFYRFLVEEKIIYALAFLLVLLFGFMVHILMPVMLIIPIGVIYLGFIKRIKLSTHALIFGSVLIAVAANIWWIRTVLIFMHYRVITSFFSTFDFSTLVLSFIDEMNPEDILIGLGLWGVYVNLKKEKILGHFMLFSILYFFILGKLGSEIPVIEGLEPDRFSIPLYIISLISFLVAIEVYWRIRADNPSQTQEKDLVKKIPISLLILFFATYLFFPTSFLSFDFSDKYLNELKPVMKWLNENTNRKARIAFLDFSPGDFSPVRVKYYIDREFIGGPFSQTNLIHNYANFTPDRFFAKPINELLREDVSNYCYLYNIKWIVSFDDDISQKLDGFAPAIKKTKVFEPEGSRFGTTFSIYVAAQNEDFFLEGSGQIEADLNTIQIKNASPGSVVIKYHWLETLKVDPDMPIEKYSLDESPIGFIKILNGQVKDFVVYNSYDYSFPFF